MSAGQRTARILCFLFAILGALPLGAGFFIQSNFAHTWASSETSRLLRDWLNVRATYAVELSLVPLHLALEDLRVESSDGGQPAIAAKRIAITPRFFSLLAGRLDVGDIEVEGLHPRLVLRDGKIANLNLDFENQGQSESPQLTRAPFKSLSASDVRLTLDVDGVNIETGLIDLDVFAQDDLVFETALRVGESTVKYPRSFFVNGQTYNLTYGLEGPRILMQWDEDRLCRLDARVQLSKERVLVRRLELQGVADTDPEPGSTTRCPVEEAQPDAEPTDLSNLIQLTLRQVNVEPPRDDEPLFAKGQLQVHGPVDLINRFTDSPGRFEGWARLEGEVGFDGRGKLPTFVGSLETGEFTLAKRRVAEHASGQVELRDDVLFVPELSVGYGGGDVDIHNVRIALLEPGVPLTSELVRGVNVRFPYLIRDVGITPDTIINWDLEEVRVTGFKGVLVPPTRLDGALRVVSKDFEITSTAYHDPARQHVIGVPARSVLEGNFGLSNEGIEFNQMRAKFGDSELQTTVHVRFNQQLLIDVPEAKIHLHDIGPLVSLPIDGVLEMNAHMNDKLPNPLLTGTVGISDLVFAGFPLGHLEPTKFRFMPLWVEFERALFRKNVSAFVLPHAKLEFATKGSTLHATSTLYAQSASVRDFLAMWNFDKDPRWADLRGALDTQASLEFTLGGKSDPCGRGDLHVLGSAKARKMVLFEELYDEAASEFDFHWQDIDAGYHGFDLTLNDFALHKGSGVILGSLAIRPGAEVSGNVVASNIPLGKIQGLGSLVHYASGSVSALGTFGGTLDQLSADIDVNMSPLIVGRSRLPASRFRTRLIPRQGLKVVGPDRTRCNRPIPLLVTEEERLADKAVGDFVMDGEMFSNRIQFRDLKISRQRDKVAKGNVTFEGFELGPFFELLPAFALQKERPTGSYTGDLRMAELPLGKMTEAKASLSVDELTVKHKGFRYSVQSPEDIELANGTATIASTRIEVLTPKGSSTRFDLAGRVTELNKKANLALSLKLHPVELEHWSQAFDDPEQFGGELAGAVELTGPWDAPKPQGGFTLTGGLYQKRRDQLAVSEVNAKVGFGRGTVELQSLTGKLGGGTFTGRGVVPLAGLSLGEVRGNFKLSDVAVPSIDGIDVTVNADVDLSWAREEEGRALPKVSGEVELTRFRYSRPVTMNADIATLTRRGHRTEFESYDPAKDFVDLDLGITARGPLQLSNNLIEAALRVEEPGLQLTGTNQRFGLRGRLEFLPGGHIQLRRNEFEVQEGEIRFADATAIVPQVDVTAMTEYRRYSNASLSAQPAGATADGARLGAAAGQWRITMRAHGDADDLKIDLTSQPKLSQDDIFFLLTVGLTRAELDQAQAAGVGQSVALEALGSLTGADTAVTEAIPVIDEFRFGSAYSSRTGRTEPTITIGKRLTERIRAYVTSGMNASREVRSNVQWQLNPQLSVEGSYDNVNNISSGGLGNLGADIRWRLEFDGGPF